MKIEIDQNVKKADQQDRTMLSSKSAIPACLHNSLNVNDSTDETLPSAAETIESGID
jgi:hypothetical protein